MSIDYVGFRAVNYTLFTVWLETQAFLDKGMIDKHTAHGLDMAIITEIGELAQALKPDWAWWKRADKEFEYGDIPGEIADIMHFTLARINYISRNEYTLVRISEEFRSNPMAFADVGATKFGNYVADWILGTGYHSDKPGIDMNATTEMVPLGQFPGRDLREQITTLRKEPVYWGLNVIFAYGDPQDLHTLYYDKAETNLRRWGRESDIPKLHEFRKYSQMAVDHFEKRVANG